MILKKHLNFLVRILFLVCCFSHASVWASGYSDPVSIGPRAIGLGGAYVGIADDPTAVYHNPAAITHLKGDQLAIGFDTNVVDFQFTPPGGTAEKSDQPLTPAPFGFFTHELAENISVGLGIYFPHGNVVKYPSASANVLNPKEVSFYTMEITPVVSVEIPAIQGLSLGMGFRIVRLSSSIKNQGFVLSQAPLTIDALESIDLTGWATGAVFAGMYRPVEWLSMGAVYHTPVEAELNGGGKFTGLGKFTGTVSQNIPGLFTTGIGLYPNKKLTVGVSYDYEQNAQNDQVLLALSVFPGTAVLPLSWKDSHTIHAGVSYNWIDSFYTSVGYARDLTQTIQDVSSDRGNTDFDAHFISAGAGMSFGKIDVGAAWKGFFGTNTVPNNGVNPIPGKYKIFTNTISMDVAYQF